MKRIITIACIAFCLLLSGAFTAHAQSRGGVVTASSMVVTRTKVKKPSNIKWQNNVDLLVSEHYQLSYTGGWRFGNFMFLGFGAGVQYYQKALPKHYSEAIRINKVNLENFTKPEGERFYTQEDFSDGYYNPSKIAVPIYGQAKFRFTKGRFAPFIGASYGILITRGCDYLGTVRTSTNGVNHDADDYELPVKCVSYLEGMFGLDVRVNDKSSISLSFGPICTGQKEEPLSKRENIERVTGGFRLGYSF